jgi:hypothetical protein
MKSFAYSLFFLLFAGLFALQILKEEENKIQKITDNEIPEEAIMGKRTIAQVKSKKISPLNKKQMIREVDEDSVSDGPDEQMELKDLQVKYNLQKITQRFGDDEYYISQDISIVRADEYVKEMGEIVSNMGNVLAIKATEEFFDHLAPVVVNKHTGRVEYPTGDVVVKTNEGEAEEAIEQAQKIGLRLKKEHKEISTIFFNSSRPRNLFSQARHLQGVNGVVYARVEIIPGFQTVR